MESHKRRYMDNAATSFPKPQTVHDAMMRYATELGASPGRGSYYESKESGRLVNACRDGIVELINGERPEHVIFTLNCSDALNLGIKGLLRPGDHVITTDLEHNSILRPLNRMLNDGVVTVTRVPLDPVTGLADPEDVRKAITPRTRLIAALHGSNVTGTVQDIESMGQIAREAGVRFLVDAAQTLGHMPVDIDRFNIDLLAAPGHKGLLGPLGTGFLYIRPGVEAEMTTIREGGTGSVSEFDVQPEFMPDRFEPGSHNTLGIIGLLEGLKFIQERGIQELWAHEQQLIRTMIDGLQAGDLPGLTLYGPQGYEDRCGVFSVRVEGFESPNDLADALENDFGLLTRPGLHCAPGIHRTLGTDIGGGTTRFSFGPFVEQSDVEFAVDALSQICQRHAAVAV